MWVVGRFSPPLSGVSIPYSPPPPHTTRPIPIPLPLPFPRHLSFYSHFPSSYSSSMSIPTSSRSSSPHRPLCASLHLSSSSTASDDDDDDDDDDHHHHHHLLHVNSNHPLPDRWDVLGLGQAMVYIFFFLLLLFLSALLHPLPRLLPPIYLYLPPSLHSSFIYTTPTISLLQH